MAEAGYDRLTGKKLTGTFGDEGMNQSEMAQAKSEAKANPDNQNPARSNTNTGPTTTKTTAGGGSRTIMGLMGITVVFAVAGHVLKEKGTPASPSGAGVITAEGKIILGGFFATAALMLIADGGDAGREFATGLALIAMLTSALVYGGPVWTQASKLFGSAPTTPLSTSSKPTTPTVGVQTGVALAQAA